MQQGTGAGARDLARNGDRGAGFWEKHRPRNSPRVLGCLALLSGTVCLPFPPQCFPQCPSVLSRIQRAEGSSAVSSCEQLSWREPGVLPTQTVPGFCLLHWDNTHIAGPELCLSRDSEPRAAAWLRMPSGAEGYRENSS